MDLLSLPQEVLEEIFSFLMPKDVQSLSLTCKSLNQLTLSDSIWTAACYQRFGIKIKHSGGFSKNFYKKVLTKYGDFLGLWNIHADCYGGLLHIKFSDGKLCAKEIHLPKDPHITHALRSKTVFEIDIDEWDNLRIICCINPHNKHPCTLSYGEKALTPSSSQSFYLTRQCAEGIDSAEHQEIPDVTLELERWVAEQSDFIGEDAVFTKRQMIYKYLVLRQMDLKTNYSRLILPRQAGFPVPIQPGLFKGTYSCHGLELIALSYEDDRKKLKAVKITGDPNVPAGQITFRADLPYCMHLTEEEQISFESIEAIQPASSEVEWNDLPTTQPFVVPYDCVERYDEVPKNCRARFHGFGQIAAEGFREPSFVAGHWIVFNEDLFGFLWMSLQSLSMYHRVQERFTN